MINTFILIDIQYESWVIRRRENIIVPNRFLIPVDGAVIIIMWSLPLSIPDDCCRLCFYDIFRDSCWKFVMNKCVNNPIVNYIIIEKDNQFVLVTRVYQEHIIKIYCMYTKHQFCGWSCFSLLHCLCHEALLKSFLLSYSHSIQS